MKRILVSGYFDGGPHSGHLELFRNAAKLGQVWVIVNNHVQSLLKKGYSFLTQWERLRRVRSCKWVDEGFLSIDEGPSVSETIAWIHDRWPIHAFLNEGDVKQTREQKVCDSLGIKVIFGKGKKVTSSSDLIKEGVSNYVAAQWPKIWTNR